jgi:ATP adenylyltransferase
MEQLWSPWRSKYIGSFKDEKDPLGKECFLCLAAKHPQGEHDREFLIIERYEHCYVIMNRYPYNNGHLLVSPYRHIGDFTELSDAELLEINIIIRKLVKVLTSLYSPDGFNIGLNIGRAAGAGFPGHIHFHVLPRWNGDTSFTATLADIKVVSESLDDSYLKIKEELLKV